MTFSQVFFQDIHIIVLDLQNAMNVPEMTMICSLREEPVKLSIEVPRKRFWLTFTFLLETISGLIIKNTINPNIDILALGFELNFQQESVAM